MFSFTYHLVGSREIFVRLFFYLLLELYLKKMFGVLEIRAHFDTNLVFYLLIILVTKII